MASTINAHTSSGLIITPDTSGEISFQSNGTTVAGINSTGWTGDGSQLTGITTLPDAIDVDGSAPADTLHIDANGNIGINNTNPDAYNTSGKVLSIKGTSQSNPAALQLNGSSTTGAGYYTKEVFQLTGVSSAQEISRVTGTGANGWRGYFKIMVNGHTGSIGNGINIKEYYWDGGTSSPVQISSYTNGAGTPVISFNTSTSNTLIVYVASSNGGNTLNANCIIEWSLPPDFSSGAYTIS